MEPGGSANVTNLIIKVDQIEEPRQLERRTLTRAFLDDVFKDAPTWHVTAPAELQAHLTRVGERDVLLEGATAVSLQSECRRCLHPVSSEIPVVFTLNLVNREQENVHGRPGRPAREERGAETTEVLDETSTDEETFDGDTIDLAPILREQLLLGLPAIEPLCKEACKGLCAVCGQDLNEKDCGHGGKQPDPRWSALKNLKV